ncbi:MAG: hypothetical protein C5B54_03875 [Acidobacteria bacterium]|nr:MAG: hypothetical protein C5B54_03875 [Acidobacteriota bacterium]
MEIEFRCPECHSSKEFESDDLNCEVRCDSCQKNFGSFASFTSDKSVQYCAICGCRDLYTQKDFNRKVGCAIAALGAIFAPFTKLISLFVCALIDLLLYRFLPVITICYRCQTIYRDFPINPQHEGFNLGINDRYRAAERK